VTIWQGWISLLVLSVALATTLPAVPSTVTAKRIAFIIESWYPASHADVIGKRFLQGYRVGERSYSSPVTVASVYAESPAPNDQTRELAARYGFRVAASVPEALLDDPRSPHPRLAVDGVLIATREDIPRGGGQLPSPTPRLQVVRQVLRILAETGTRVPIFIDKMLAANWADSQAIVSETARQEVPLMAGSVLPYMPLDRPVRSGKITMGIVIASAPYWAYAFHAAELLQGFMERRSTRETGISAIREIGSAYWSLAERNQWGGQLFDALLASAKTRKGWSLSAEASETYVLLIQYVDGTRAVLALVPRAFEESEFLLGAQLVDGTTTLGGVALQGPPFDHFGYLVHALVEFFVTGRAPVPAERALLTTGIVLNGLLARQAGPVSPSSLAVSYGVPQKGP
jgi:hypothetical protein